MGLALGRVVAHEAVTHYLLSLSNAQHTGSGLTRAGFGSNLFSSDASNQYNILAAQAAELRNHCRPVNIPDNYAGGGGGDVGGGGYIGGGGFPWYMYSTWAFANWVSSIRIYHTDVFIYETDVTVLDE